MAGKHGSLSGSSFSGSDPLGAGLFGADDVNPLATVANLTDVMLVFAVALIIALINVMDVDFTAIQKVVKDEQMEQVEDFEVTEDEMSAEGTAYTERGIVYEDPETGDLYLVEQ